MRSTDLSPYLIFLLCAGVLPSCGILTRAPPAQTKTFETSVEYLNEGKQLFESGQYAEAQKYLLEAIRLDPSNQPARVLAGVTWARLGKAGNARRESEKAVEINKKTADAATAEDWLKRLESPLTIAIFPFENLGKQSGYGIERSAHQALYRQLFESGLYSITDERQLGYRGSRQGSRESQTCHVARDKGVKIALLGIISEFRLVQDKPPPISLGDRVSSFYAAVLKASLQIYATSDCRLLDTFSRSAIRRQIPDRDRNAVLQQMVNNVFQQLALDVHKTLM